MFYNYNTVLMLFFTTASFTITLTQSTSPKNIKTGKSFVNEATSPGPISSRFLDLGGVISQLFPGFNQGTPGGNSGLNFLPNSQFYPGVLTQGFNSQPAAIENKWSNLNQGIIQGRTLTGGFQSQQPRQPHPNSLNFNSQTVQYQGQLSKQVQDLAQILNIQNNNTPQLNLYTSEPDENLRLQRSLMVSTDSPQIQDLKFESDQYGAIETRNEGTLEDFFTTQNPKSNNIDGKVMFPNYEDEVKIETTTKNALWGKLVQIPTTTLSSDRIVFIDDTETPFQKQCVQNCPTTSEYNPVCGSDSVTYFNPGRLVCARNCGINVRERRQGSCNLNSGR